MITEASKPLGTLPTLVDNRASGRKYMLATQCSKPAAMKAETGNMRPTKPQVAVTPPLFGYFPTQVIRDDRSKNSDP